MKKILLSLIAIFIVSLTVAQKKNSRNLDRSIRPTPTAPPGIKLGDIQSFDLPNGLRVFVVENHKIPVISCSIVLNIYPALEGDASGLAGITSSLMTSGTNTYSKDEFDNAIDFIGAELSVSPTGLFASSLKRHNRKLIELISDVLLNTSFKQEELDKLKKLRLSELAQQLDDPEAISENVSAVLNYGKNHPLGELTTEESIHNITLEKCTNYFKTYFRPNVAFMAVVGDITVAEIKPLIEKYFSSWEAAEVPNFIPHSPTVPEKTQVAFVNKPGAVQSVINITYPVDLKPNSEDVIKTKVLNSILGGSSSSRLFMNLREKHGYTYGSYSALKSNPLCGEFSASANVRNAVTDSAITEMLAEMRRLKTEKVSQSELDSKKNYLTGDFALSLEDPATVARFAINIERYNLSKDYYAYYLKKVAAVTADDVLSMANKYILPENANIVVVGNQKEIAEKLEAFSPDRKINYYTIQGNPTEDTLTEAPAGITVKAIINAYVKAIGGAKAIKNIKDISLRRTGDSQYGKVTMTEQRKYPNKYNMTITIGDVTIQKIIYDGNKGKQSGMQGEKAITGDELTELRIQAFNIHELYYEKLGYKLEIKGVENINKSKAYVIDVTSPTGKKTTEWYDVDSGFKVRTSQTSLTEEGNVTQTIDYTDYKDVNGTKYPTFITIKGGSLPLKLELTAVEINKGIDNSNFKIE